MKYRLKSEQKIEIRYNLYAAFDLIMLCSNYIYVSIAVDVQNRTTSTLYSTLYHKVLEEFRKTVKYLKKLFQANKNLHQIASLTIKVT